MPDKVKLTTKVRNWISGWRTDVDGFLVRARREGDPCLLGCDEGFIEESAIAARSHDIAARIDAGRSALQYPTCRDSPNS